MTKPAIHLTVGIPYVNGKPHLGHVLEWFQADAVARYYKTAGYDVSFTSGADENSLKNVQAAEKAGASITAWLDEYSQIFVDAYKHFGIELTGFRRGSDQKLHWPGVQELWNLCVASGDIYKKRYQGLYCVGCESFYTQEELVDGKCPEHLVEPELIEEENYFFKLSKYQDQIQSLIESDSLRIVSNAYKQEMLGFIKQGLTDFSVSRNADRARGIGVPIPGDESQVMYVWFDALAIYMTAIGWGYDKSQWEQYWPNTIHTIGKGINRFHSVYWIGILLSANLPLPKTVSVHGYITIDGQKMSKSLGNVIDPYELVAEYGIEPIRYYLLKEVPSHSDGDFSFDRFKTVYTADLSNGIGNLCSRVATLCEKNGGSFPREKLVLHDEYTRAFEALNPDHAVAWVISQVAATDQFLSEQKPWMLSGAEQHTVLKQAVSRIRSIAFHLQPFMPQTAAQILEYFNTKSISKIQPLFPRLEK